LSYLTGINEPNVALVLEKTRDTHSTTLFVPERTPQEIMWEGRTVDPDLAVRHFGADEAFSWSALTGELSKRIRNHSTIYIDLPPRDPYSVTDATQHYGVPKDFDTFRAFLDSRKGTFILYYLNLVSVRSLTPVMHRMRLIKTEEEQAALRNACAIGAHALSLTMQSTPTLDTEHQLHALFEYECKKRGASHMAYHPVVAGRGANGCIVHYTRNDMALSRHEMVLMDAGCYYNGYASDITRTFPASGRFSPAQRTLYDALLDIQMRVIAAIRSDDGTSLESLLQLSAAWIRDEIGTKILKLSPRHPAQRLLYPHHIGHYLGMDVHDCSDAPSVPLMPGMAFTVEPGIYIPPKGHAGVDAVWDDVPDYLRGIAIRIEDDVLLTTGGAQVLTHGVPKTSVAIESLMRQSTT
jgi:Xaa-Pro aminopeptidase